MNMSLSRSWGCFLNKCELGGLMRELELGHHFRVSISSCKSQSLGGLMSRSLSSELTVFAFWFEVVIAIAWRFVEFSA